MLNGFNEDEWKQWLHDHGLEWEMMFVRLKEARERREWLLSLSDLYMYTAARDRHH
jgi:hypothetical protein